MSDRTTINVSITTELLQTHTIRKVIYLQLSPNMIIIIISTSRKD